jgi:hypothetical protein
MKRLCVVLLLFVLLLTAVGTCVPTATPTARPKPTAAPTATHSPTRLVPTRTPTVVPTTHTMWQTYSDAAFGISLQHPAGWLPVAGSERRYAGPDGFFQLNAMSGAGWTIDEVADNDAHHKLQPYGSEPRIERLLVQGREARLILPSADQPKEIAAQAGLIVDLPRPIQIAGESYRFLILWADVDHIRDIASTLELGTPLPQGTLTPPAEVPAVVQSVRFALAGQFRLGMDDIHLLEWERVDWPNGCLGIPMRSMCTEAIVPGYRVVLEIDGQKYEYRCDLKANMLLLAAGPAHGIEEPVVVWEGESLQTLLLAADGRAAVGPCDAPLTPLRLAQENARPQQLAELLASFAPFDADTPSGRVSFRGYGEKAASAAWQRAVAAWAQLVQAELESGRSGASWGTALSWRAELSDRAGFCQFLQVEEYGFAFASVARCEGGEAQNLGRSWLTDSEVQALDTWLYERLPLDLPDLGLFGQGTEPMAGSEISALRTWVEAVYARLTET